MIGEEQRAGLRSHHHALQRQKFRALHPSLQRVGPRREPPHGRPAAVRQIHAAVGTEREVAEDVRLLISGPADDRDHPPHRTRREVDLREPRRAIHRLREATHRRDRRSRRPQHAIHFIDRETQHAPQIFAFRSEAAHSAVSTLVVLRRPRAHPHAPIVRIAEKKLAGRLAPRDAFDHSGHARQRKRDLAVALGIEIRREFFHDGRKFFLSVQRPKLRRFLHGRMRAQRREFLQRDDRVIRAIIGELRRREIHEHARKIRAQRHRSFHLRQITRLVACVGCRRRLARERHGLSRDGRFRGPERPSEQTGGQAQEKDPRDWVRESHGIEGTRNRAVRKPPSALDAGPAHRSLRSIPP